MNIRILNLIWGVDKTKFIVQHKSYNCKCGKNESVFNSKEKWNSAECRCEYKEIGDWGSSSCDMDYICNPSTLKNENLRIFNLMSRVDKTKVIVQHESYDCKCGTNEIVFNSKQKWNSAECRCEYKEIDD